MKNRFSYVIGIITLAACLILSSGNVIAREHGGHGGGGGGWHGGFHGFHGGGGFHGFHGGHHHGFGGSSIFFGVSPYYYYPSYQQCYWIPGYYDDFGFWVPAQYQCSY